MNFEGMSEKEILDIATPIMDNLMDASTKIDHEAHIRDFTDRMKNIVTKEHLQKICEQYQQEKGLFSERKFVAIFKRPDSAAIVWKQSFTKAKGEFVAEMFSFIRTGDSSVIMQWSSRLDANSPQIARFALWDELKPAPLPTVSDIQNF